VFEPSFLRFGTGFTDVVIEDAVRRSVTFVWEVFVCSSRIRFSDLEPSWVASVSCAASRGFHRNTAQNWGPLATQVP